MLPVSLKISPPLDPTFVPAVLWNRAYRALVEKTQGARDAAVALEQPDGAVSVRSLRLLPDTPEFRNLNVRYVERMVKFLLWQRGGSRLWIGGASELAAFLSRAYAPGGERSFDDALVGRKIYLEPITVNSVSLSEMPAERQAGVALGRHLSGCRIGIRSRWQ